MLHSFLLLLIKAIILNQVILVTGLLLTVKQSRKIQRPDSYAVLVDSKCICVINHNKVANQTFSIGLGNQDYHVKSTLPPSDLLPVRQVIPDGMNNKSTRHFLELYI